MVSELEYHYANIQLVDIEGGMVYGDVIASESTFDDGWCLVGQFFIERAVNFEAEQHIMASLWQPGRGMFVKELHQDDDICPGLLAIVMEDLVIY